jgi:biotin carboxyl carrier protein
VDFPLGAAATLMKYITTVGDQEFTIEILGENQVNVNGKVYEIDYQNISGQPVYSLLVNGGSFLGHVYDGDEDALQVLLRGTLYEVFVEDEREKRLRAAAGGGAADSGEFVLKAPMPGLVVKVPVEEGAEVSQGDVLLILESMKMQNELKAPRDGTVNRVLVKAGDSVEQRQTLLSLE